MLKPEHSDVLSVMFLAANDSNAYPFSLSVYKTASGSRTLRLKLIQHVRCRYRIALPSDEKSGSGQSFVFEFLTLRLHAEHWKNNITNLLFLCNHRDLIFTFALSFLVLPPSSAVTLYPLCAASASNVHAHRWPPGLFLPASAESVAGGDTVQHVVRFHKE
jgi:hypothetical protein